MTKPKTLGWGLIGASNVARTHMVSAINAQPESRVVAVMDQDSPRAVAFVREFNVSAAHHSLAAILADPQVDIAYISTTNDVHYAHTLAAARAGKHVLCEKPLASRSIRPVK